MKILKQVESKERLPNKDDWYFVTNDEHTCNNNHLHFELPNKEWYDFEGSKQKQPKYWYEKVDFGLNSKEILPLVKRHTLDFVRRMDSAKITLYNNELISYIKALEAAELEIARLKASKSAVRANKRHLENTVLKEFMDKIKELENHKRNLSAANSELIIENQSLKMAIEKIMEVIVL